MTKLDEVLKVMQKEPNYEKFQYKGYTCMIRRSMMSGHFCGYVGLPEGHKYYKKGCDDIPIECHGGLTFADWWEDENDDLWYIGFDCAHYRDYMPFMRMMLSKGNDMEYPDTEVENYWTVDLVRNECKKIVDQLLEK